MNKSIELLQNIEDSYLKIIENLDLIEKNQTETFWQKQIKDEREVIEKKLRVFKRVYVKPFSMGWIR
jgi:hypothetical protein